MSGPWGTNMPGWSSVWSPSFPRMSFQAQPPSALPSHVQTGTQHTQHTGMHTNGLHTCTQDSPVYIHTHEWPHVPHMYSDAHVYMHTAHITPCLGRKSLSRRAFSILLVAAAWGDECTGKQEWPWVGLCITPELGGLKPRSGSLPAVPALPQCHFPCRGAQSPPAQV